jgi:hypothetical protein
MLADKLLCLKLIMADELPGGYSFTSGTGNPKRNTLSEYKYRTFGMFLAISSFAPFI